jgi:hypothetical protein
MWDASEAHHGCGGIVDRFGAEGEARGGPGFVREALQHVSTPDV